MKICIAEDHNYRNLFPLTKTRPVFGLRCGRFTLEERLLSILGKEVERTHYVMRPELIPLWKSRHKSTNCIDFELPDEKNFLFLNGRVLFDEKSIQKIITKTKTGKPFLIKDGNCWIAFYLPNRIPDFSSQELIDGRIDFSEIADQEFEDYAIISYPWDLIRYNSSMINKDFIFIKKDLNRLPFPPLPENVAVLNSQNFLIGRFSDIQPFVTFNAEEGPIIIGDNVRIESGAYIKGPVSVGDNCFISSNTNVYKNTTLGNTCKVGGEISHSIIHGFTNKRHNGFLGNSYLGEWINLGAGTNNSNMKNNYNTISVRINGEIIDTNRQFIGLYMGDHSRTAIGTQINTATFAGVGCNIFGGGLTPKTIHDFSWGGIHQNKIYNFQKFVNNAHRMMIRREVEMPIEEINLLHRLHQIRMLSDNHHKKMVVN